MYTKIKSFTLIEIIIVVIVTGVLATALITKVIGTQARARNVARVYMVNQLATAVSSYEANNKYYPSTLEGLIPTEISSLVSDPRGYSACHAASTNQGNLGYLTYSDGSSDGLSQGYIVLAQVEAGGVGIGYDSLYLLTGNMPCDSNIAPVWHRVANSVCISKPGWINDNPPRSQLTLSSPRTTSWWSDLIIPSTYAQESPPTCNGLVADFWVDNTNHVRGGSNSGQIYNGSNLIGNARQPQYKEAYGVDKVIVGTDQNDTITYRNLGGNDTICSLGGDDTINSINGNDWIDVGNGNNTINSGVGNDIIISGDGNDKVDSSNGDDLIEAGSGLNTVDGGPGKDLVTTGDGNDIINGGDGDDIINAGNGTNTVNGGNGQDQIRTGNGNDLINGDNDPDIIYGGAGEDEIHGQQGNDLIYGEAGNDRIYGEDHEDTMYGGDGDDIIEGSNGNDTIYGGAGNDTLKGDDGNDRISGGDGDDNINAGGNGFNIIYGGNGIDSIVGGSNPDWVSGGDGVDTFDLKQGPNTCSDLSSNDIVIASSCDTGGPGNGGRDGFDTTSCSPGSFVSACNSDYDQDGISNTSEGPTDDSDLDGYYDWQESSIPSGVNVNGIGVGDPDGDGVPNQIDPENNCACIPNATVGCSTLNCNSTPGGGAPVTPITPISLVITGVDCAAYTSLPYNSRLYYAVIR